MSNCCTVTYEGDPPNCPMNDQVTRPVGRQTVEGLVRNEFIESLTPQPYYFCDAPDCDTVYVSALSDHVIIKDMLKVRVGIKEKDDPIPLCYCFEYDRKDVFDDVRQNGYTDIQKIITQRVKDGECRCELTNPSGGCCLGAISKTIKQALAMKEAGLLS